MTLEEIKLYTKKTSKAENNRSLNVFYSDVFPESIYRKKHPHLSDGEIEYIKENYNNPVKKVVGDAIFETQKIFNEGNFTVDTASEIINDYISKYEINNFFKNIYWQNILLDSGCVLTYNIKYSEFEEKRIGIEKRNEYLPVHPYVVTPENILYRDKTRLVYKVKGDKKTNFVALYYNEDNKLTYEFYSYDTLDKNTTPLIFWQFPINTGKRYFRNGDGIKIVSDNELVVESYFSPSIPLLSSIVFDSINLSVTQMRTTFPIPVIVGDTCSNMGCTSGKITEIKDGESCEITCPKCLGTGYDQPFNPFNTMYVTKGNNVISDTAIPSNPLSWVEPPQSAVNGLKEQIKDNLDRVFDYIGVGYTDTNVRGKELATNKLLEREDKFGTFKNYSTDIQMTMQWWYDGWVELMFPLEPNNEIKVKAYHNFRTLSTAEINTIFTELRNANAPLYQLRDMLRERYTAVNEIEKFEIIDKYFLYYSDDSLIKKGSLGYYDKGKIVISENIMKWVDEVIDMPEDKIDSYLTEKAQSLMAIPVSDTGIIA